MLRLGKYNVLHAIAATLVLGTLPFLEGFKKFWQTFVYGQDIPNIPAVVASGIIATVAIYGGLIFLLWLSTWFTAKSNQADSPSPDRRLGVITALKFAVPIFGITLALAMGVNFVMEHLIGLKLAEQGLVKFFTTQGGSWGIKAGLIALVLIEAPVFEEVLFRGIVFRGYERAMPTMAACLVSGLVFSFAHANAATLIPLWFLGAAFAWVYHKTGTILASMSLHFLFNAIELVCAIFFPEMASA